MAGATLASRPIAIFAMVVLARLLSPDDFGMIALVMVLFSTARIFSGLGMDNALIHSPRSLKETGFQAFAITCMTGLSLFLLINWRAADLANLMGNDELTPIVQRMSWLLLFDALSIVPEAILRRELQFRKVSTAMIAMNFVTNALAIALAWWGFGVWSLVWGYLAGSFTRMLMMFFAAPGWSWLLPRRLDWSVIRELVRYGVKSTSSGLVDFVNSHWDDWFVGRTLGTTALGFYDRAYFVTNSTIVGLNTSILSSVFMPAYAHMQTDDARLARTYLKSLGLSSLFMAPLSMGVLAVAPELVRVVFGAKWVPMIPTLQVFAFMALARPLAASTSPLFRAVGHPEYDLQGGLVVLFSMVPMVIYMSRWGIEGVAVAVTLSFFIGLVYNVFKLNKLIPGTGRHVAPVVLPSLIASALMVVAVTVARPLLDMTWIGRHEWLMLLALTAVGGIVFIFVGYFLQRKLIHELLAILVQASEGNKMLTGAVRRLPPQWRMKEGIQ